MGRQTVEEKKVATVVTTEDTRTGEQTCETVILGTRVDDAAEITAEFGLTINVGNYNSVRIGASLSLPCQADEESVTNTFTEAWKIVTDQVIERKKTLKIKE
jgi:hypothetical protein